MYVLYKIKLQVSNGEIEKSSMYLNALVDYFNYTNFLIDHCN